MRLNGVSQFVFVAALEKRIKKEERQGIPLFFYEIF